MARHVTRRDPAVLARRRLDRVHRLPAGREIGPLGDVAGGEDAGDAGLEIFVDENAEVGVDAAALEEPEVGRDAGGADDEVGVDHARVLDRKTQAAVGRLDAGHLGRGQHLDALALAPAFDHLAAGIVHHAREHAAFHLDDGEIDPPRRQRLEDDAADEAGAHEHDARARPRARRDPARILERPAVFDARQVHPRYRRPGRVGAGGDEQPVVGKRLATVKRERLVARRDAGDASPAHLDLQLLVMAAAVTQMRALLADAFGQEVWKRHPRIRRLGLVADQRDGARGVAHAQRLRGDHPRRPGADNDVVHGPPSRALTSQLPGAKPQSPSLSNVSWVGIPSGVQPRSA